MAEAWNLEWLKSELLRLRDMVTTEQAHVRQRFEQVNELRRQVLDERGVFVRHEALGAMNDRVARIEQSYINRAEHDAITMRLFTLEKSGITRIEYEQHSKRIGMIESKLPVVALVATGMGAIVGATTAGIVLHFFGVR